MKNDNTLVKWMVFVLQSLSMSILPVIIALAVLDGLDATSQTRWIVCFLIVMFFMSVMHLTQRDNEISELRNQKESLESDLRQLNKTLSEAQTVASKYISESDKKIYDQTRKFDEQLHRKEETIRNLELDISTLDPKAVAKDRTELIIVRRRCEALNEQINLLALKVEKAENSCMQDLTELHKSYLNFLFPTEAVDTLEPTVDIAECESFSAVKEDFIKKIKTIEAYKNELSLMRRGLAEKRYSPYIYSTLAEAYSNRIIADYYRNKFKPNEILSPIARISAELHTLYLEALARKLDWGSDMQRTKKVASIRELRREAKEKIEEANFAKYQLLYLLELYPQLEDVLDMEQSELASENKELPTEEDHDSTRDYLSTEEYNSLSVTERNQLALDRYIESRRKSKWQVGRDYELYIGYLCENKHHCTVEYTGSLLKLEDLGRDLIVHNRNDTYIIQCKYWSKEKTIHEKHIFQLFGTVEEYKLNYPLLSDHTKGVFVTSTSLSEKAKLFADRLGIQVYENVPIGNFPRIKCNINVDRDGFTTYIYHLPMDLSYDSTKIDQPGEFMAMTVKEAENAGFRRSYKWHGQ